MPHELFTSGVKTILVDNDVYETTAGVLELILKNKGGADAKYRGNLEGSVDLILSPNEEISLRMTTTRGKSSVRVDAAGTKVQVTETN